MICAMRSTLDSNGFGLGDYDYINGFKSTKEIYLRAQPDYANRYTVPILWDDKLQTIGISLEMELI